MKLIATLRSPLLLASVLSLSSRHTNAFTSTSPVHVSTFTRNQQSPAIELATTTTPPIRIISKTAIYAYRNLNDDTDRTNKFDSHAFNEAAIQLSKTIMMVSFISTSMFVADVASVSAVVSVDHMNGTILKFHNVYLLLNCDDCEYGHLLTMFSCVCCHL